LGELCPKSEIERERDMGRVEVSFAPLCCVGKEEEEAVARKRKRRRSQLKEEEAEDLTT
jgi:hypothetical protein